MAGIVALDYKAQFVTFVVNTTFGLRSFTKDSLM
jgi:hypothetical protein